MLTTYETRTRQLLQNPAASTALYAAADIDTWINMARGQLAGESESVRRIATLNTVVGQRNYNFSSLVFNDASVSGAIHVRRVTYSVGTGQRWIPSRAWEWFDLYHMNNPVPANGVPIVWAQYGQGSSGQGAMTGAGASTMSSGSLYLDPPPNFIYQLNCDCVCYPALLALDTDAEALPYLFTDAVPFLAAYYALLSSQTSARQADAERMFNHYQTFMKRARQFANPSVNRGLFEQSTDPTQIAKLGLKPTAQVGGG